MQTNATLNQKRMSEKYFENTRLVYVNSFYSAGYPHAPNTRATCQKTEIRLLKNRQCTYYQNWPEFPGDPSGTGNTSHTDIKRGTWVLRLVEEHQLELTIAFSDGSSRSFTIHINHFGHLFLNGKRFQVYKIKK